MTSLLGGVTGAAQHISDPSVVLGVIRGETDLKLSTRDGKTQFSILDLPQVMVAVLTSCGELTLAI